MQQQIDIKTIGDTELKSMAYDTLVQINLLQNSLQVIERELAIRKDAKKEQEEDAKDE